MRGHCCSGGHTHALANQEFVTTLVKRDNGTRQKKIIEETLIVGSWRSAKTCKDATASKNARRMTSGCASFAFTCLASWRSDSTLDSARAICSLVKLCHSKHAMEHNVEAQKVWPSLSFSQSTTKKRLYVSL